MHLAGLQQGQSIRTQETRGVTIQDKRRHVASEQTTSVTHGSFSPCVFRNTWRATINDGGGTLHPLDVYSTSKDSVSLLVSWCLSKIVSVSSLYAGDIGPELFNEVQRLLLPKMHTSRKYVVGGCIPRSKANAYCLLFVFTFIASLVGLRQKPSQSHWWPCA